MAISGVKENPRILLLAGGVEFQRADLKLSSMDTLIEQESKFMEILVDKIMSLRPGKYCLSSHISFRNCFIIINCCYFIRYYYGG